MECDLKPCPFCGSTNVALNYTGNDYSVSYFVHCKICGCRTKGIYKKLGRNEDFDDAGFDCYQANDAIALWNERAH